MLLLSLWRPFVTDALAEDATPTQPVWNPLYPTETPAPTTNYVCPPDDPAGWGTVTPDPYWMIQCGNCAEMNDFHTSTPLPTNTPWPTPTHDGTGTPYPTEMPYPDEFYSYQPEFEYVPYDSPNDGDNGVSAYLHWTMPPEYRDRYFEMVGVNVEINFTSCDVWTGFGVAKSYPEYSDHFWYPGSMLYCGVGTRNYYLTYSPMWGEPQYPFPYSGEGMWKWYVTGDVNGTIPEPKYMVNPGYPGEFGNFRNALLESGDLKLYINHGGKPGHVYNVEKVEMVFYGVEPTGVVTPTPYAGGYCESVLPEGTAGDPGINLPIITVTDPICLPIGGQTADLSVLNLIPGIDDMDTISIPGFQVCYQYISFGTLDLFGMTVDLDLLAFTIGAIALLRIFLRS